MHNCKDCNGLKAPLCEIFDDTLSVDVVVRDINGKRKRMHFQTRDALLAAASRGCISDEDEILLVYAGCMCIYSALGATEELTVDDLTGFFG